MCGNKGSRDEGNKEHFEFPGKQELSTRHKIVDNLFHLLKLHFLTCSTGIKLWGLNDMMNIKAMSGIPCWSSG